MKTIHAVSTRRGRLGRQITSVLLALSLTVGMLASTATPAYAASYVRGCFQPGNFNADLWSTPVELWAYDYAQNAWYVIGNGELGPNGCQYFFVPPDYSGYFLIMVVNVRYPASGQSFFGHTPIFAWPGDEQRDLGTGVVTCTGCW